jgi:hypothetical protein
MTTTGQSQVKSDPHCTLILVLLRYLPVLGVARGRTGGSAEDAFDRLRRISQSENVKLAVIAQRVLDETVRRAQAHGRELGRELRAHIAEI